MDTFHLSCHSADRSKLLTENIGGLIIFSEGEFNGIKYKPGYVYLQTKAFCEEKYPDPENVIYGGKVHGQLSMTLFGRVARDMPSGFLGEGFARMMPGKMAYKSKQFNFLNPHFQPEPQNEIEEEELAIMDPTIHSLLEKAIEAWAEGMPQNLPVYLLKEAVDKGLSAKQMFLNYQRDLVAKGVLKQEHLPLSSSQVTNTPNNPYDKPSASERELTTSNKEDANELSMKQRNRENSSLNPKAGSNGET